MPTAITRSQRTRGTRRAHAYRHLREAIVRGELHPGQRLSENGLAEWLGVSRTPIRETLVRLVDDGLVEIAPQLGTFVTRISTAAVADAQFIREALECSAVRLAAVRADRSDVAALRGMIAHQEEAREALDFDRFHVLDDELHGALCELSGHGAAWSLAQRSNGHLNRVRRLSLPQPDYLAEMVVEHARVVDAVEQADPGAAEAALRHHLQMVLSGVPAIRAQHPDYFEDDT